MTMNELESIYTKANEKFNWNVSLLIVRFYEVDVLLMNGYTVI